MTKIGLELPYPPALNSLYRSSGKKWYISKKAKEYKDTVYYLFRPLLSEKYPYPSKRPYFDLEQRLSVTICVYYPDKRKRDVDGILKVLFDSMTYAGVWGDDSQVKRLYVEVMSGVVKGGRIWMTIEEIDDSVELTR